MELPHEFLKRTKTSLNLADEHTALALFDIQRPITIRTNTLKMSNDALKQALSDDNIRTIPVEWWKNAFIMPDVTPKTLTALSLYEEGRFYIQNLSSMIPPLVLAPEKGDHILDLTAAPGSKTTQIAAMMGNTGSITANDISRTRLYKLKANIEKCAVTNTTITSYPAELLWKHYPEYFDRTLLDAPCSLEGTFYRYDPASYANWSTKHIKRLSQQQKWMLRSAISATKPGGTVVYSTCTLAPEENEEVVNWLLEKEQNIVTLEQISISNLPVMPGLTEWNHKKYSADLHKTARIVPSDTMEGFFVAKIKKIASNVRYTMS